MSDVMTILDPCDLGVPRPRMGRACRGIAFVFAAVVTSTFASTAGAADWSMLCTMDYRPVCGLKNGRWQTYSNRCVAETVKARRVRPGECRGRGR